MRISNDTDNKMAEQVYVYGATAARPASYSYGGYAAEAPGGMQPMYSVSVQQPGQSYSYEQAAYPATSLGAPGVGQTTSYAQSEYGQPQYTLQVVAASQPSYAPPSQTSGYAQAQSGAYATVPVGASPYATAVVAPAATAYAPGAEQQLSYGQPTYVSQQSYVQQQQQGAIYAQSQGQVTPVYGQLSVQQSSAQPQQATYGLPASQQSIYGQPVAQQQAYGQPAGPSGQTVVIQHANPAYGQSIAQQGPPGYGAPAPQHAAAAYGQPPPGGQQAPAYAQPPQVQLAPPPQQTVYVLPSAAPQPMQYGLQPPPVGQPQHRPTLSAPPYGRPISPADMVPYDQRSVNFTQGGRCPPGALVGPSVVLNAVLGGSRGHPASFSRGRDGPRGGFGGRERSDGADVGQILDDTVFIQGLPDNVTEELLAKHFSVVGAVKVDTRTAKPRVWLCRDKVTGRPRGDGIVGYEQVHSATAAIDRFHRTEFLGTLINVRHATKKPNQQSNGGGAGGMLSRGRGGGDGDDASDQEGNDGRSSPSGRGRGGSYGRGGSSMRGSDRGRGGQSRGMNGMSRGRGGPGRGGPMRGRDRFERRDHPY